MTEIRGRTFTNETVRIDDHRFLNCRFHECTIYYSGGDYFFDECVFDGPNVWQFQDAAQRTIQLLKPIGYLSDAFAAEIDDSDIQGV